MDDNRPIVDLRVLATTDLHMHILPYDYLTDAPSKTTGLARTAALIRVARAEATNTLLVDNGDFLHGTPMGDELARSLLARDTDPAHVHPIVAAMTQLGYDAITLGNHDFDHGTAFLAGVLQDAVFPVICTNARLMARNPEHFGGPGMSSAPAAPHVEPFSLIERVVTDRQGATHPLRIGIIGFLPPGSVTGLRGGPFGMEIRDIVHAARSTVPHLRALGADVILALAHSGIGADSHSEGMENAIVPLAAVDGIDAIVAGHAHQVFPGDTRLAARFVDPEAGMVHGKPVVAPGFWGSHLGLIDLTLARRGDGTGEGGWEIVGARAEARPISARDPVSGDIRVRVAPEPGILRMMEAVHDATLTVVRNPVGRTKRRLHTYFATIAPSPAVSVVQDALSWYVAERVAGTPLAELPLLASSAPFKAGGLAGPGFYTDIAPGPIALSSAAELYLYNNDLCALRLTGAEVQDWLERAASVFNTVIPGKPDQPLLAGSVPAYTYETVAGVDYQIDLTAPPRYGANGRLIDFGAERVRDMRISGVPVAPEAEVLLVTNSFRVTGGGNYPRVAASRIALDLPVSIRDVLIDYLATMGPYDNPVSPNWRFAPSAGTSVTFASAPAAAALLGELPGRDITPGEIGEDGFRCYRLAL